MHILINGIFWHQPNVGSGQYLHNLVRWLPRVAPEYRYTLLVPVAEKGSAVAPPEGVAVWELRTPFDGRNENLTKLWFEQIGVPMAARLIIAHHPTLVHIPYFAPPLHSPAPVITTVGDIIPLALPEYRGSAKVRAYMALVQRAVRQSAHLLTFSAFSKADIVARLEFPAVHVTPILLAADERYRPGDVVTARSAVAARYGLHEPFIYYVGGLDARKNLEVLVRAFARLRRRGATQAILAIAGRALGDDQRLFPNLDALIAELDIVDAVRRIDVPHADGPLLYQACTLFAFPSRYEGFGLPPLEAMACGAPVVASNASSLPEVVGDAALVVDPDDIEGWVEALGRALQNEDLRADLRVRSLEQAAHFTWRQTAAETVRVYARVAEEQT